MATNTLLTPNIIVREALMELHNNLAFTKKIDKQYSSKFADSGGKIGDSIDIRNPIEFKIRSGSAMSSQDITHTKQTLQITNQEGVDMEFTSKELTLDIELFSKNYIRPAMKKLASHIDFTLLGMYDQIWNQVGIPGTPPATMLTYLEAGQKMNDAAAPIDDRCVMINPLAQTKTVDGLKALFNNTKEIGEQYVKGSMGSMAGFDFYMTQNINTHTTGTFTTGSTPVVDGASQVGASLATDGWAVSTAIFKKGDTFTIAGVYDVNPEIKQQLPQLQQFVVTADTSSDGSGDATIPISPSINVTSPLETVSNSPANDAVITPVGTEATAYPVNMSFEPQAFTLATADMIMPNDVGWKARMNYNGISMRVVRQWRITDDIERCRFDVLYGYKCIRPEYACRIIG